MSDIADKWGAPVAERGFAQIPNYLLLLNQFLDEEKRLAPLELLLLVQIAGTWWRKEQAPFPGIAALSTRSGASPRQVQRSIGRLEELGLLKRVKRRSSGIIASNAYDLTPLVSVLQQVARAFPNAYPRDVHPSPTKRTSPTRARRAKKVGAD